MNDTAADRTDPRTLAATYFRAWADKDFTTLRTVLADDVSFRGPLATVDGVEDCLRGLQGMSTIVTDIVVRHVFADESDVLTWFDLHTTVTEQRVVTANWSHVADGRISRIRVTFDPRPLGWVEGLPTGAGPC
ncbi:MAG: nuclear transport factor 2 family protein [Pseudonocardia sp.]|nr:nuclear transport factor 2 family protein [Pseudonocardia sp.]